MAASPTDLKEYVDELTKCPICLEDLVNPKSVPCLHTFCIQCIKDHCRKDSPGDQVNCPVCRSSFVIPVGGVEKLPNNFYLKGLADAKTVSDKGVDIITCIACSDDSQTTAMMHCTGCGHNVCDRCSQLHGKIPGHDVVPLGSEIKMTSDWSFCSLHPCNRLKIYCIECSKNVCVTCHVVKHKNHNCQDINEVYEELQSIIERDVELVLEKEKSIQQELTTLRSEQHQAIDGIIKSECELLQIVEEIKRLVDDTVSQLMMRLSNEKAELSKVSTDRNNQFEFELVVLQSFTRNSIELVKRGKPCDITHAYTELHTRAGELLQFGMKTGDYKLPARTVSPDELFNGIFYWILTRSPSTCAIALCCVLDT